MNRRDFGPCGFGRRRCQELADTVIVTFTGWCFELCRAHARMIVAAPFYGAWSD